jgi:prepilin-type N-terminal cleavage/methylation domain-containing protein
MAYKTPKLLRLKGFSLVEMIIVIGVFSILAFVITQALVLTLRGAQKGRSIGAVRENVEYSLSIIERQLRNARSLNCSGSTNTLLYTDENGRLAQFSCITATPSYIASGSAEVTPTPAPRRLTNTSIAVNCGTPIFTCDTTVQPHSVRISVTASDAAGAGAQGETETFSTELSLRNY